MASGGAALPADDAPGRTSADPRASAVIVLDLQHDVVDPAGKLAGAGAEYAIRHDVVGKVARLASAARATGIPVIHVHNLHVPGHPDVLRAR